MLRAKRSVYPKNSLPSYDLVLISPDEPSAVEISEAHRSCWMACPLPLVGWEELCLIMLLQSQERYSMSRYAYAIQSFRTWSTTLGTRRELLHSLHLGSIASSKAHTLRGHTRHIHLLAKQGTDLSLGKIQYRLFCYPTKGLLNI